MILSEVKAGRGSPHGGAFLDIAWIKDKVPGGAEHIKKKLPSMYHQFKQLADLDITEEPMEVGPTTHYVMGGILVDGETQETTVPGLFAAGECASGLHGANRLGGNSLSDLVVFGQRAGQYAAEYVKDQNAVTIDKGWVDEVEQEMLAPFGRGGDQTGPYQIQYALQECMQNQVGIIRQGDELEDALRQIAEFNEQAKNTAVNGNREYNPGWHTALDLHPLLVVSEMIARSALHRTESRGAHTRDDHPEKSKDWGNYNLVLKKGTDGEMQVEKRPITPMPEELQQIIEEQG